MLRCRAVAVPAYQSRRVRSHESVQGNWGGCDDLGSNMEDTGANGSGGGFCEGCARASGRIHGYAVQFAMSVEGVMMYFANT